MFEIYTGKEAKENLEYINNMIFYEFEQKDFDENKVYMFSKQENPFCIKEFDDEYENMFDNIEHSKIIKFKHLG